MTHSTGQEDAALLSPASARREPRGRATTVAVGLLVVLVLAAVFVLPWAVPQRIAEVQSDSQAVGFNNRVAMLGLLAGVVAAFVIGIRSSRRSGEGAKCVRLT